jgi:hypothetical protein
MLRDAQQNERSLLKRQGTVNAYPDTQVLLFLATEAQTASVFGSCARHRPPPIIEIRSRGP